MGRKMGKMDARNNHSHDGFLQAIIANPDDDTPRLIYADWLDDHGDSARAEFIRMQIELAHLPETDPRSEALAKRAGVIEKAHARGWLRPLREALDQPRCRQLGRCIFGRGFLERVSITPRRAGFLTGAQDFLGRQPLRELLLTGHSSLSLADVLIEMGNTACFPCLRLLDLCGTGLPTAEALHHFGSSDQLEHLTGLGLSLTMPGGILDGLGGTPLAHRLRDLHVHIAPGATESLLELLTTTSFFPTLESIGLGGPLNEAGLTRLVNTSSLSHLRKLWLFQASVGPQAAEILITSSRWSQFTNLDLSHCPLGDDAVRPLAAALAGSSLGRLRLAYAGLTETSVSALTAASWGALEDLSLEGNNLGESGTITLARSPHLTQLRRLNLYSCKIGEAGARELAASPHVDNLLHLQLYESNLSLSARRALRKRFGKAFHFGH
jgi:uncharacterized protein (TIGR02996 family)